MSRVRVEDLGRIAVLLDNLLEQELFQERRVRAKDFSDWFNTREEDHKEEIVRGFAYGIDSILEDIYKIREIAYGEDSYNTTDGSHD